MGVSGAFGGREIIWVSIFLSSHVSRAIRQRHPGLNHVKLKHREVETEQNNTDKRFFRTKEMLLLYESAGFRGRERLRWYIVLGLYWGRGML